MSVRAAGPRRRIDLVNAAALALLIVLSSWVLAVDLWQVVAHGRSWTGTGGMFLVDQMQYLAWVQDASHHLLVSNLFTLAPTTADFAQPLIIVSGGLAALGVAPYLALLVWQPVAVLGLYFSVRAYVRRALEPSAGRGWALVLGLFFIGSGSLIADKLIPTGLAARLQWSAITADLWLGFWSWGYPFGLIALAATLAAILRYERAAPSRSPGWAPPALGALASLIHPWQGATLIIVLLGAELLSARVGTAIRLRPLLITVTATALPLVYFLALNHLDPSWTNAQNAARGSFPLWMIAATVAPLAIPAALAYRIPPRTFVALVTRLWPFAALALFLFSETRFGSVPTHALLGISIPLAVLAVEGVGSLPAFRAHARRGWWVAALVGVAFVPATAYGMSTARRLLAPGPVHGQASGPGDANYIAPGERRALDFLAADASPGGVLTRFYLGTVVPGLTGRRTYVGNPYFSPNYLNRSAAADALFLGQLGPRAARELARASGARFLLSDCRSPASVSAELSPISSSVHHFGCATVFVLP